MRHGFSLRDLSTCPSLFHSLNNNSICQRQRPAPMLRESITFLEERWWPKHSIPPKRGGRHAFPSHGFWRVSADACVVPLPRQAVHGWPGSDTPRSSACLVSARHRPCRLAANAKKRPVSTLAPRHPASVFLPSPVSTKRLFAGPTPANAASRKSPNRPSAMLRLATALCARPLCDRCPEPGAKTAPVTCRPRDSDGLGP